ncbi:RNA polymerase sigma factor [Parachryseolinea silvisoli]|uniref:RNA polymerase sigma factor n=1 Tax=Parachryseolinea silvisoli TaxID=2873601 RepID=UPI0022658337|nr:DUF6596 domain-containing protein [Parachryseolinea silvisoli]MCD9014723.1 RNA polymerase subunit sigma [Parachryseolinea silvisoli]
MIQKHDALKQLFQREFSKMVAVIARLYGLEHIALAEDIVSETFLQAMESWEKRGMPEHATAWLYAVAKQKTLYHFRRTKILQDKVLPSVASNASTKADAVEPDFSQQGIRDSQLQMMFAICTPAIASEAQIGLALRILCGFGIDEIAEAFLSNKETINKRLFRAREKLRTERVAMEFPPEHTLAARLDNVLHILYLLFNEGYYSTTQDRVLQKDMCIEAMRLCLLLTDYPPTRTPKTHALLALMCFHASRFNARQASYSDLPVLYEEQDEQLWDQALINQGRHYLNLSVEGDDLSSYHLEARIASWHCIKEDTAEKWEEILQLYNDLLFINYSPSVALNRTFALYKARGWQPALAEAEKLRLENNHFYFLLLGELYRHTDALQALAHFRRAHTLARTQAEKRGIQERIDALGSA